MLSLITYFLYIRECKILHYISITLYTKTIFQIKILKQWKVGNGFVDLRS